MHRLAALALVLIVTLTGCGWSLQDATHPVFLAGSDAQVTIDREAGDMLAVLHPGVAVGPSKCGYLLDLTHARKARCTIPVAGRTMRIDVSAPYVRSFPILSDVDALVVKRDAERSIASDLSLQHGGRFTVRCDGEPVRVVPLKQPIPCTVTAPGVGSRRIEATPTDRSGNRFDTKLRGVATLFVRMFGPDVATRRTGGIDLAGPTVAGYLRMGAGGEQHDELVQRGLLGPAHCPPRVVLAPNKHVACTVRAGTATIRYDLRFDLGRGFIATSDDIVVVVPAARELVQRYYERELHAAGTPHAASVDCGRATVLVTEPGTALPCTAHAGTHTKSFSVGVEDESGQMLIAEDG